jgi:hypothetical protein
MIYVLGGGSKIRKVKRRQTKNSEAASKNSAAPDQKSWTYLAATHFKMLTTRRGLC